MAEAGSGKDGTVALSTKVEEEFVAPLTAIRGALEILRDYPDIERDEVERFVQTALHACTRLEAGIDDLAVAVYAAARQAEVTAAEEQRGPRADPAYLARIQVHEAKQIIELDFSDFVFSSSQVVNDFYDAIESVIDRSGLDWYFLINFRECRIWPEAWVAFAHRGKRISVNHSLGTIRFIETAEDETGKTTAGAGSDPSVATSREAALQQIAQMKAG